MSGFVLHPDALTDQYGNISLPTIPVQLAVFLRKSMKRFALSSPFPQVGHSRSDLTSRPLRFHPLRDFLIVYAPDEKPLLVLAILHGRRNPRVIAALLRDRR